MFTGIMYRCKIKLYIEIGKYTVLDIASNRGMKLCYDTY